MTWFLFRGLFCDSLREEILRTGEPKATIQGLTVVPERLNALERILESRNGLRVPILSDMLRLPLERGKVLVGLYEPSAQWLSLILTIASWLRRGHVVGISTLTTPTPQIRQ